MAQTAQSIPQSFPQTQLVRQVFCPAKINLFLHIVGPRADGYHELQTVFRKLAWGDELRFYVDDLYVNNGISSNHAQQTPPLIPHDTHDPAPALAKNQPPVRLFCADHITPNLQDNLIYRAAQALTDWLAIHRPAQLSQLTPYIIHVTKNIPMGAGLGGGSSNAASTLQTLNELWQVGLSPIELRSIGAQLGADVPCFLWEGDCIGEGIGEHLTAIDLPQQQLLLLMPSVHLATAELFRHPQLQRDCTALSIDQLLALTDAYTDALHPPFCNVFEPVSCSLSHEIMQALTFLRTLEPIAGTRARMTGSGSTLFLPYDSCHEPLLRQHLLDAPCTWVFSHTLP